MPAVRPFRGIEVTPDRYASHEIPARIRLPGEDGRSGERPVADLTDIACPPYDVIAPDERAELLARDPHNAVRLELSAEADPHRAAAGTLAAWLADGTLRRRDRPALYHYANATTSRPDAPTVHGVLARVLLEPFGTGVRAHEHTMSGPKAERLALLDATATQLSPILALYFDRSGTPLELADRPWKNAWRARDGDGLLHAVTAIRPDADILERLSAQTIYIADGHHRYETALAYQARVRSRPDAAGAPIGSLAADWIMAVLVDAETSELEILPTHRLLLDVPVESLTALVSGGDPLWQAIPVDPDELPDRLAALPDGGTTAFGLLLPDDAGWLLVGDADGLADRMRREPVSDPVRRLDLAVLHAAVLGDRLGIDAAALVDGNRLAYTRSVPEARAAVAAGQARAALLVRPTRLEQVAEVASAGDVMPQKSTYFHPKLLTGFVFNPLEE